MRAGQTSVRAADTVPATSGFGAGKRTRERKRFIVTDTARSTRANRVFEAFREIVRATGVPPLPRQDQNPRS
ncbi:hypothetical protein [Streptomyces sp. NBC_01198]|uniref:hypothetical protein n=1 Tax=Streptomyces sp. NBC_01198 TaxID=2903769 RepID=UPI002E1604B6|nr:hypothetical protein OG702_06000 [Streptomyces sp. NBC_01198]